MEPIPLRGIKHREATGSREERRGGDTDLRPDINQYPACSDKSSQLQ